MSNLIALIYQFLYLIEHLYISRKTFILPDFIKVIIDLVLFILKLSNMFLIYLY